MSKHIYVRYQISNETEFWSRIQNYQANCICGIQVGSVLFASVISCDIMFAVCLCEWIQILCVCVYVISTAHKVSVTVLCHSEVKTAFIWRRHRTRHRGKRSSAQTVSLKPKQCRTEPLAIEGPSAGGWGWVLVLDRVRHSIGLVLSSQSGPRLSAIKQYLARQLRI